ncbi:MAG: hypothetical protein M1155_00710 [Patescibacteria group bacterium]|nr:hypothetical protein [Patescibacteria group bacterium]
MENIKIEVEFVEQEVLVQVQNRDFSHEDPAKLVESAFDLQVVLAKVGKGGKTNARCAEIIRLRYLSDKPHTQREIAKRMRISACRVGQLEERGLSRLRKFGVRMGLVAKQS